MNSSRPIPDESSVFALGSLSMLFGTYAPPLSRTSLLRCKNPGLCARPFYSIPTVVTPCDVMKERRKKDIKKKSDWQAPSNGASDPHRIASSPPSVLPDTPEPPFLFLCAAGYLQSAIFLAKEMILKLDGIRKWISSEGAAKLRPCHF
jgi:hypothetical protein